jgi:hypothetical protein
MSKIIVEDVLDDLDNALTADQTINFSFQGIAYEIDLTDEHATQLREVVTNYANAGRRVSNFNGTPVAATTKGVHRTTRKGYTAREVREWARAQGMEVSDFGRLHDDLIDQYRASQVGQTVPAPRTVSKEKQEQDIQKAEDLVQVAQAIREAEAAPA